MSNSLDIPEDLLEIISDLVIYEDRAKDVEEDYHYEYAYDYVYDYYIEQEKERPSIIKIDL